MSKMALLQSTQHWVAFFVDPSDAEHTLQYLVQQDKVDANLLCPFHQLLRIGLRQLVFLIRSQELKLAVVQ